MNRRGFLASVPFCMMISDRWLQAEISSPKHKGKGIEYQSLLKVLLCGGRTEDAYVARRARWCATATVMGVVSSLTSSAQVKAWVLRRYLKPR
jgi:hypothetical protein